MKVAGGRVRQARDDKGLSRATLAQLVGVSESTIERIETDRGGDPAATTLALIARNLDVNVDTLFEDAVA